MKVLTAGLDATTITFLQRNGIVVEAQDVEDAQDLKTWLVDGIYDAGVLDLDSSKLGIYACRGVRNMNIVTPLVGISHGSTERVWGDHRAMFLENGGDDLLRGPVNPRELVASLRAVARRFNGGLVDIAEYRKGNAHLKVNLTTRTVLVNNSPVHLTARESAMLLLFASSPGRILSKENLLNQMYVEGINDEPEIKIIDVFVCKLRRKLTEADPDLDGLLETVWGQGYRMTPELAAPKVIEKAA